MDKELVRTIRENAKRREANHDIATRRNGWERWHARERRRRALGSVTREGVPVGRKLAETMMKMDKA